MAARNLGTTTLAVVRGWRWSRLRLAVLLLGIVAIVAGVTLIAGPLFGVWQRGQADNNAINSWAQVGSQNITGPKSGGPAPSSLPCGSGSPSDYALVKFGGRYNYAAVSGDGDWSLLTSRSMVHYKGTPDPGQKGNVIVAFHREPDFEHIDELGKGAIITVEDRSCHTFRYQVTDVQTLDPSRVTQLRPTNGHDLTLVTCTPWWKDNLRIIWRATLLPN